MLVIVLVVVIDSRDVSKKHPSLAFVHVREQRPAFEQQRSKFDNEHDDEHEHDSGTKGRLPLGWHCSRHFVPGYDRTVPPGRFATASN